MRPSRVKRLFKFPFRTRADVRDDVRGEFELHIELRTRDLVEKGLLRRVGKGRITVYRLSH